MKKVELILPELTCTSCQNRLEKFLKKHGINDFMINLVLQQLTLNISDDQNVDEVLKIVKKSGFDFELHEA